MTYAEKLKDQRWLDKRIHILKRDKNRCQAHDCKDKLNKNLQVHHVIYFANLDPWDYSDDLLITLCNICHERELIREKIERQLLDTMKLKGFLLGDLMAFQTRMHTEDSFVVSLLSAIRKYQR